MPKKRFLKRTFIEVDGKMVEQPVPLPPGVTRADVVRILEDFNEFNNLTSDQRDRVLYSAIRLLAKMVIDK